MFSQQETSETKLRTYIFHVVPIYSLSTVDFDVSYLQVTCGGLSLGESPYRVGVSEACDPQAVVIKGPGIEKGVMSNSPTHFDIDCRKAGPGKLVG